MISAFVFVLFVRDKYTINTFSGFKVESILALAVFIPDEEQADIKRNNANSVCVIGVVIFITLTLNTFIFFFHLLTLLRLDSYRILQIYYSNKRGVNCSI